MTIDADHFRAVLGRFTTGVTVVTATDSTGRDHGMTVNAFSSVSLSPPLILVCIDNAATMASLMRTTATFAVNILSAGQEALSRRFAADVDQRFAGIGIARSDLGNALLEGALAHLDCRAVARHPTGDHVVVIGEVHSAAAHDGRPLLYYRGGYAQLER